MLPYRSPGNASRRLQRLCAWTLGRSLRPGDAVHHRNGDPTDNHPNNLQVLPSQRAHMLLHHYRRQEACGVRHLFPLTELLTAYGEAASPWDLGV